MNQYDKIIVSHYGKVASNSLVFSLSKQLNCERKHIKNNMINYSQKILTTFNNYEKILEFNKNKKILFITISRNLIEQDISMQFQLKGIKFLEKINKNELSKEELVKLLKKRKITTFDNFFEKFENEFKIEIYSQLNPLKNYLFYENVKDNIDFLFLKFEKIKEWEKIFKSIFNFDLKLEKFNTTEDKLYVNLYKEVLEEIKTDEEIIKKYSKTKHFKFN
jgi:hypothetical protein